MYKLNTEIELSKEEMDRARRGFFAVLWRRRFKPEFIENHGDDLLAKAHLEYVRCVGEGVEIEDPITWTIHCAWRRTQSFLEAPKDSREVTTEKLPELEDREAPTTEQRAEDQDRARKIRLAVARLRKQEQQIIALTYLEDMSVREAGRQLGWPEVTARRRFKSAMKRLEEFFEERGIESSDDLVFVGLASYLASAHRSPGILEVAFEKIGDAAAIAWEKAHDLPRRVFFGGGGDAASVAATSGAGRAAGACATVAIACVVGAGASGVVGPGIGGGIGLVSGHHHSEAKKAQSETATAPAPLETSSAEGTESEASTTTVASETEAQGSNPSATTAAAKKSAPTRVREQTDAAARISSESTGQEVQAAPSAAATSSSVQNGSAGSSASSSTQAAAPSGRGEEQAAQQFGGP